jgi:Uma2 family endonuclease
MKSAPRTTRVRPTPLANGAEFMALIDRLGGIDPARVRLNPQPGTATEKDLIRVVDSKFDVDCELVEGTLVEKAPVSVQENYAGTVLLAALQNFVSPRRCGVVLASQAMLRLAPGIVRLPDVTFIVPEKWRAWSVKKPAIGDFGPDICVEVLSKSNTPREQRRKRNEYFASGTRLVWEVNPRRRAVTVYTSPTASTRLTEADTLTGGDVLPGFQLPLADLFADPLGGPP